MVDFSERKKNIYSSLHEIFGVTVLMMLTVSVAQVKTRYISGRPQWTKMLQIGANMVKWLF